MPVRRAASPLRSFVCLVFLLPFSACKAPPPPAAEAEAAGASAGAPVDNAPASSAIGTRKAVAAALEGEFQCNADGKARFEAEATGTAAQQAVTIEGDPSPEARAVVADGLCQRHAAYTQCLAKEREAGRFPGRTTWRLSVADHVVSQVEGGTAELTACLGKAWQGSPAGAASAIAFQYVPGPNDRPRPNVNARDVKAPEGVSLEVVAERLRAKNAYLRACYEMALREQGGLAGTILVEQDLGKEGKATKTRVKAGTLQHPSFEKCVERRLGDVAFGEPKGGKGTLRYTLVFSAR